MFLRSFFKKDLHHPIQAVNKRITLLVHWIFKKTIESCREGLLRRIGSSRILTTPITSRISSIPTQTTTTIAKYNELNLLKM